MPSYQRAASHPDPTGNRLYAEYLQWMKSVGMLEQWMESVGVSVPYVPPEPVPVPPTPPPP